MAEQLEQIQELSIGIVLFPRLTILDLTGPYEVLTRLPNTKVYLIAASTGPLQTEQGLTLLPDTDFEHAPPFDMLLVPGGPGQVGALEDQSLINFVRERGRQAKYVTSVCTGSLILGAAGLLEGYRATTHWRYLDLLKLVGAEPVAERVVVDRNRITGAGVSAGIDFALTLAARLFGEAVARQIQLGMEYDPAPPFQSGSPRSADPALVSEVSQKLNKMYQTRREQLTGFRSN